MNDLIKQDLYRVIPAPYSFTNLLKGLRSKGFKYMFVIRLLKNSKNGIKKFFLRIILRLLTYRYGFQIPFQTEIGGGFYIGHFGTIVISINATIGKNCNIAHNVTIGAARGKRAGAPKIGNLVWMGTGSVITGNITIGDNVLIAPNAFVNADIPSNSIAMGNPAQIIKKDNPTEFYINNIITE